MKPRDIQRLREQREMSQSEFGEWMAGLLDAKPYSAQRVSDWENGRVPVPARIVVKLQEIEIQRLRERLGLFEDEERTFDRNRER